MRRVLTILTVLTLFSIRADSQEPKTFPGDRFDVRPVIYNTTVYGSNQQIPNLVVFVYDRQTGELWEHKDLKKPANLVGTIKDDPSLAIRD